MEQELTLTLKIEVDDLAIVERERQRVENLPRPEPRIGSDRRSC
jgi:hypothetical protein